MMGKYYLCNSSHKVHPLNRFEYDVVADDIDVLDSLFDQKGLVKGDVVFNCIGAVKQRNFNKREFVAINSHFPHQLAMLCEYRDVQLIHLSSDCVFSGDKGRYLESSSVSCTDTYGISKALGEPDNSCCIRTSIVGVGSRDSSSLLDWAIDTDMAVLPGFTNHFWNGLTVAELTRYVDGLISGCNLWRGVRHVYGNRVSKYELLCAACEAFSLSKEVVRTEAETYCDRSLSSDYFGKLDVDDNLGARLGELSRSLNLCD